MQDAPLWIFIFLCAAFGFIIGIWYFLKKRELNVPLQKRLRSKNILKLDKNQTNEFLPLIHPQIYKYDWGDVWASDYESTYRRFEIQLFIMAAIWAVIYFIALFCWVLPNPTLGWGAIIGDTGGLFLLYYFIKYYNFSEASKIINSLDMIYIELVNFNGDLDTDKARLHVLAMNEITEEDIDTNVTKLRENQTLIDYRAKKELIQMELLDFQKDVDDYLRQLRNPSRKEKIKLSEDLRNEISQHLTKNKELKKEYHEILVENKKRVLVRNHDFKEIEFFEISLLLFQALESPLNKDFAKAIHYLLGKKPKNEEEKKDEADPLGYILTELICAHPNDPEVPVLRLIIITRGVGLEQHLTKKKLKGAFFLKGQTITGYEYKIKLQTLLEGENFVPYCRVGDCPRHYQHPKQIIESTLGNLAAKPREHPGEALQQRILAIEKAKNEKKVDTLHVEALQEIMKLMDFTRLARKNQELMKINYEVDIREFNMEAEINRRSLKRASLATGGSELLSPTKAEGFLNNTKILLPIGLVALTIIILAVIFGVMY